MSRIEKLISFIETTPNDSFLQHALALEYVKVGEDATAEKLFTEILAREPGYVGSYYHLGKLLERIGQNEKAIEIYKQGMGEAKKAGDNHSYNELQGAVEDMEG
jgi:Tfp pilus assembly protein PilF